MTTSVQCVLTLFGHSHCKAPLQAAVLTAVPCHLVDNAVLLPVTRVHHVLLDAPAEKTLQRQNGGACEEKVLTSFCFQSSEAIYSTTSGNGSLTWVCLSVAIKAEREERQTPSWELCGASNAGSKLSCGVLVGTESKDLRVSHSKTAGVIWKDNWGRSTTEPDKVTLSFCGGTEPTVH